MQVVQQQSEKKVGLVFVALPAEQGCMPELIDSVCKDSDGIFRGYFSQSTMDQLQQRYAARQIQMMREADYDKLHDDALRTEPEEITEKQWVDALGVLPPMKWHSLRGVESFRMSEFYSGTITTIYAKCDGRYWKFMDDAYMDTNKVTDKVLAAMAAKVAQ